MLRPDYGLRNGSTELEDAVLNFAGILALVVALVPTPNVGRCGSVLTDTTNRAPTSPKKIEEFLGWCSETDVEAVTLWLLSTDNFDRPQEELGPLLGIIEDVVRTLAADGRWRVHHVGTPDADAPRQGPRPGILLDARR